MRQETTTGAGDVLTLAIECQQAKDYTTAEALYRRFLRTHPNHLVALNNAALVAKALGRRDVALLRLARAARRHAGSAEAHFNLANTLQELDRLDEAVASYRTAIALRPDYRKAHLNLGNALDSLRRFEKATDSYLRALAMAPDDAETHCNLANCLKAQGLVLEALTHFLWAAELEPDRAEFHYGVGIARFERRENHEAIVAFRRVLELNPTHDGARSALLFQAQLACDWNEVELLAPAVRAATDEALAAGKQCSEGPFESITRDSDPRRNHGVALAWGAGAATRERLCRKKPSYRGAVPSRIVVGYLSADFREHPVAQVMGGVFGRHDRARFAIHAYSTSPDDGSPWRKRIAADCDSFVDLFAVNDRDAAERIAADGVDILVDLTLWTFGNRPRIAALRPAAVQAQYLGFPGTSGASCYDYAIVDRIVAPPEHRSFWSEHLAYMPHSYFVTDRDQPISSSGLTRAAFGLPAQAIVFSSFNQTFKIDRPVFEAWMRILAAVPGSVLWISDAAPATQETLRREAARRGIAVERLVFAFKVPGKAEHLERLALADVALDTLNYNGHTTTSDALWAGVPVVAVRGRHFASRVSASLLQAVGLPELAVADVPAYERLAIALGTDAGERTRLRAHLLGVRGSAPLFDTDATVAALERAYERMMATFRAAAPLTDISL